MKSESGFSFAMASKPFMICPWFWHRYLPYCYCFFTAKRNCAQKNELESNLTFHLNLAKTLGCFVKYDK